MAPVNFTEPETFEVNSGLAEALGYSKLVILPGNYTIDFSQNPYGSLSLNIDLNQSVPSPSNPSPSAIEAGIRIARREQRNRNCTCCGGIGFRCGFVLQRPHFDDENSLVSGETSEPNDPDPRNVYAQLHVTSPSTLKIAFQESGDWETWEAEDSE